MVGRSACMTAVYIGVEVEASAEKRIRRLERRHSNSSCGPGSIIFCICVCKVIVKGYTICLAQADGLELIPTEDGSIFFGSNHEETFLLCSRRNASFVNLTL
jgi:hypothetical protein